MERNRNIQKAYESILHHDFEQAIQFFEEAIRQDPMNAEYHHKLSITFARSGKLDAALQAARRAHWLDHTQKTYKYHLEHLESLDCIRQAEACMARGKSQAFTAIGYLKQAVQLDPLAVEAYLLMGMAYADLGEFEHAVSSIKEALKLNPHLDSAKELLIKYSQNLHRTFHDKG
ncbi:tetratricopeptide repeat protein [Xylanibacillus composti]|uniref:Tetratricopeptide repeat protein n=1 Tax=Xylanibacillus composti TaxID=1572762 RepID=A0A8J4M188_9BACL|nr:tetratricopeptide repeat protein [Xylanibacillus composti]GIQ67582.1 hypothetical protein XYCOK13_04060 [Xylanibacillus composti]